MEENLAELTQRFIKAYSDLPIKVREEVLIVINEQPITWNVAYNEIKDNTELGKEILKNLKKIGLFD